MKILFVDFQKFSLTSSDFNKGRLSGLYVKKQVRRSLVCSARVSRTLTQCDNILFSHVLFATFDALSKRWDGHTSHRIRFLETFPDRCDQSHGDSSRCTCIATNRRPGFWEESAPNPTKEKQASSGGRHSRH